MSRRSVLWIVLFLLTLGLVFTVVPKLVASREIQTAQTMMNGGMMPGQGMMGGGMMDSDMGPIHQLFANHNQIRRTVEAIPGGIRAMTESDNPQIAALIQSHVASMYQRVANGKGVPMIGMSSTLPAMLRNASHYQRKFETTSKGVVVTETSNDPDLVAVIRAHGREVNRFVAEGMSGMMDGMLK